MQNEYDTNTQTVSVDGLLMWVYGRDKTSAQLNHQGNVHSSTMVKRKADGTLKCHTSDKVRYLNNCIRMLA